MSKTMIKFKCKDNLGKWGEQQIRKNQRERRAGLNMGTQIGFWLPMSFCILSNSCRSILLITTPIRWVATPSLADSSLVKIKHKMVKACLIFRTYLTKLLARLFRMLELHPWVNMRSHQRKLKFIKSRFRFGTSIRLVDRITRRAIPTMSMTTSIKSPVLP